MKYIDIGFERFPEDFKADHDTAFIKNMRNTTQEELRSIQEYIDKISEPVALNFYDFVDKESIPCEKCPNNIKNGGSGICHCILGQQMIY